MSHIVWLARKSLAAAAMSTLALAVCASGIGHSQRDDATGPAPVTGSKMTRRQTGQPARRVSPDKEYADALKLSKEFSKRDLETAIHLFLESAEGFASTRREREAVAARLEAGDVYFMMSRYQQALASYHQALTMSRDRADQKCAALSRLARTFANVGRQPHTAQQYADQGVSICMTLSDKKALSDAFEAQGETRFWMGNLKDAKTSFIEARELASQAGYAEGERLAMLMLSHTIDDHEQREQLLWSVIDGAAAAGDQYGFARAHVQLAYRADAEGNFEAARCHSENALPVFERMGDTDDAAIALNTLGMLAFEAGDIEESLKDYHRARRKFASVHDDLGELESISAIADILLSQRRYDELEALYVRKFKMAKSTSNRAFMAYALLDLAGVYARRRQFAKAEESYQQGLDQFRSERKLDGESDALERMAGLQAELGNSQPALELLREAQSLREQSGEIESVARLQYSRARLFLKLNDLEAARSEIEKTIAIIESQRLSIAQFNSRAQYFSSVHEYYSLFIQVLLALHRLHPTEMYARLAFEAAERSKVRSLIDLLDSTPQAVSCETLLTRKATVARVDAAQPSDAETKAATRPLGLDDIVAQIGDGDTLLLEFALGEDRSAAWVLDGKDLETFDIAPAAEIRNRVRLFRNALLPIESKADETPAEFLRRREAARRDLQFQSRMLGRALFGPLRLRSRTRLLIVPDGPLQYLPFGALAVPGDGHSDMPLIQLHEMAMLPSASALLSLRKSAAKRPAPADEVTVFADPAFEAPGSRAPITASAASGLPRTRELTRAIRDLGTSKWIPELPGSRNEALAIQQITGRARTRLVMGVDASREALKAHAISTQRIIHFATHGVMDARHPEDSGLVLSMVNRKGEYQDGYLRVNEIYNLKLSADLVVLSSCESALGKDLGSEGIMGLPRAFLYAGAKSVVASLWKVDDDATVPLMKTFYSQLQKGEAPPRALREAQLDMLKNPRYSHPYYWAAFVTEGDFR